MILQQIDNQIRKAFSDAAVQYDVLSGLQKEIGRELIKSLMDVEQNDIILDVGMGTGWLTSKLQFYFPESKVIGVDFAEGMIQVAKSKFDDIRFVQANARHLPFKEDSIDLVFSNLSFQWLGDIESAIQLIQKVLKEEGRLAITMFGYETFRELYESILAVSSDQDQKSQELKRLQKQDDVLLALKNAGLKECQVSNELINTHFPDVPSLLKWIKSIGANVLNRGTFIGKVQMARMIEYYENHYREHLGIKATFEVLWLKAQK